MLAPSLGGVRMTFLSRTSYRHRSGLVSVETHVLPYGVDTRREHRVYVHGSCVGLVSSVVQGLRLGRTILDFEEEGRGAVQSAGRSNTGQILTSEKIGAFR